MRNWFTLIIFVLIVSLNAVNADPIKIELISEEQTIQPGRPFWVAIQLDIEKGWHAYWKNPGDAGAAPLVTWDLPPGFKAGATEWPYPQRFDLNSIIGFGYEGFFWLLVPITPPQDISSDKPIEIAAAIEWLVCSDSNCLPGETKAHITLPVDTALPKPHTEHTPSFAAARSRLPLKPWMMQASRKEDLIELRVQVPSRDKVYSEADFFSEHKHAIDYQTKALWSQDAENPSQYVMILKAKDIQAKTLKGILVLRTNSSTEAIEVDTPIAGSVSAESEVLSVAEEKPSSLFQDPETSPASDMEFDGGIGLALVLAFAGGLLLNLMPCVLPVVSFKILSFVKLAGQSRAVTLKHGIAFSFGVILSFWVLAILLLILQAYGRSVGWGFQLQEPLFVAGLAALLFVFGLSSFGVFELGTSLTALTSNSAKNSSPLGSFFSGILATAVATPCTGPFLGTAIGFAVTLPPFSSLMIFTSLGIGMSLPYLLLAAFPQLLRFLPKPGNWMVVFKEVMGFLMLATAIWLIWVFGAQTNNLGVTLLLVGLFCLGFGCWVLGKWGTPVHSTLIRRIAYALVAISFCAGGYVIYNSTAPWVSAYGGQTETALNEAWENYSEERIAELQKKGIPVFVDFTAKWCLICQANHYILTNNAVKEKFERLGVVKMKADWTKKDDSITKALRRFGRNGVPLYVLYGSNSAEAPMILPQVLTPDIVIDYLDKAAKEVASGA